MPHKPYAIIAPCFNEEASVIPFLQRLETALLPLNRSFLVVVVDDCSQDHSLDVLKSFRFSSPQIELRILSLKLNVGHQIAIYQGLRYITTTEAGQVIVMDADGEDDPAAIPLAVATEGYDIVEIRRGKRSEDLGFRLSYWFYRRIFHLITGKSMNYGNYCMISRNVVDRISYTGFIHFPAYLLKQKANRTFIVFNRGKRIFGESKLGSKGLLIHAFKSFIEFGEDLLMLFLKLFLLISIVLLAVVGNLLYQKFIIHTAIPGWFSTLFVELTILSVLCLGFFILGILLLNLIHQQNNRNQQNIYTLINQEDEKY